eukprot:XP_008671568.1 cytochrome c oxidase subunit 5b-1, mitochondrial [Zea mays]
MWHRLHTLAPALRRATAVAVGAPTASASSAARAAPLSSAAAAFRRTSPLLSGDKPTSVEDVMPIATRLEREELEAELKVRSLPEIQLVRSLFEREELDPLLDAVNSVTRRTNRRRWQKPVSGHDGVERWRRVVVTGEDRVLHACCQDLP